MAKLTIGRWPVRLSAVSRDDAPIRMRAVSCKNHTLGYVWKRSPLPRRVEIRGRPWRAEHARNRAITFHRTMADAVADLVRTETTYYLQEYR